MPQKLKALTPTQLFKLAEKSQQQIKVDEARVIKYSTRIKENKVQAEQIKTEIQSRFGINQELTLAD